MSEEKQKEEITETWQSVLEKIRTGYSQKLKIRVGELEMSCRVISAKEQYNIAGKVAQDIALNMGATQDRKSQEMRESIEYQKNVLKSATQFGQKSEQIDRFWDLLPASALSSAFDRYDVLLKEIDPEFEDLDLEKIGDMMSRVKKKSATWRDFYTTDLAAMGRYFLETISAVAKEPGS